MRLFPSAQELDDSTGRFLARTDLLSTAAVAIRAARRSAILSAHDADVLEGLVEAARRSEGVVGAKAGTRTVHSARNLVTAAAAAAAFFSGAVSSDYATKSPLVQRVGTYVAEAEAAILDLAADLPPDLRLALEALIRATPHHLPIGLEPSAVVPLRPRDADDMDG